MLINTIFPVSVQVWLPGQTRKIVMFYKMAKKRVKVRATGRFFRLLQPSKL